MAHLIAAELRRTAQQVQTKLLMMRCANRHCEARPLQREHPQSGAHPTWSLQAHPAQRAGPLATGGRSGAAPASAPPPQRAECSVIDRGPGRWRAYRRCFRAPSRVSSCSARKRRCRFATVAKAVKEKCGLLKPPCSRQIRDWALSTLQLVIATPSPSAQPYKQRFNLHPLAACLWGTVYRETTPHDKGQSRAAHERVG